MEPRGAAVLSGVRGAPPADIASLARALAGLADFAEENAELIEEIDLNPIKALPEGRGCIVVDALIVARLPKG
jgi:acetate---CoA ligase (ADP-forming)